MDEKILQLKRLIEKIDSLKSVAKWGPEFQLWERSTEKLVSEIFGEAEVKLFKQQSTVAFSYIDEDFNWEQYFEELNNRKIILEGFLSEIKEFHLKPIIGKTDKNILKEIWSKEEALKENLLTTEEAQALYQGLIEHLKEVLSPNSLPGLRFRKLQSNKQKTWLSTESGYPCFCTWPQFQPYLDLLAQHEAEKTIKSRMETEGLFVESRSQGEDQHLLIGKKDDTPEKAHIIIDGKTGEIRIEDNQQEPIELLRRIETILTLPNGKKIRTSREAVEENL
jgi:hypothetical protein